MAESFLLLDQGDYVKVAPAWGCSGGWRSEAVSWDFPTTRTFLRGTGRIIRDWDWQSEVTIQTQATEW